MGKPLTKMRKLGAVLALLLGSSVLAGAVVAATTTSAVAGGATGSASGPTGGAPSGAPTGAVTGGTGAATGDPSVVPDGEGNAYIKICKQWTASSLVTVDNNGKGFIFFIKGDDDGGSGFVRVNAGVCSDPIKVWAGETYKIEEAYEPWYQITGISELDSLNAVVYDPTALPGYTAAYVTVPAAGDEAAVQFTDALVTGQTEICKADVPNDTLSGTFSFALTNTPGEEYGSGGLTYSVPVSVTIPQGGSACSPPVTVPAGAMLVTEGGTNLYVTSISANLSSPTGINLLRWDNLVAGESVSWVLPSSPAEPVDVVSYTNATVGLEVCKSWWDQGVPGSDGADAQPQGYATEYPFTESVVSGVAGPDTAPSGFSLEVNQCSTPTQYRAGTIVQITEGITPGTKVSYNGINVYGAASEVTPPYPDIANRTTQVIVGAPVTGSKGSNTDEAWVDFTDQLALPSTLKICKDAPAGSGPFTFTVSGPQYVEEFTSAGKPTPGWFWGEIADGSFTVTVPANECEFATPPLYPSSGGTKEPGYVGYLPYNSTQTVTESEPSGYSTSSIALSSLNTDVGVWVGDMFTLTNEPALPSFSTASATAEVTISEYPAETDITWTNVDPPAAPTAPVTVANPGGSDAGTTTAPTLPEAIAVSKAVTTLHTSTQVRSLLTKDEHQFVKLSKSIKAIEKALRSTKLTKAERSADLRLLVHLRVERQRLAFRIVKLTL